MPKNKINTGNEYLIHSMQIGPLSFRVRCIHNVRINGNTCSPKTRPQILFHIKLHHAVIQMNFGDKQKAIPANKSGRLSRKGCT